MKLPALQFYPADWRKDPGVQALNYFDRGVWFEMLCLMHESEERGKLVLRGKAMPDEALARVLGLDKQALETTLHTLLSYGVASRDEETGALMNRRMVNDERIRKIRTEVGKKGGNPVLVKLTPNQNPDGTPLGEPPPSSSSSSSTSSSEEEKTPRRASRAETQKGSRIVDDFEANDSIRAWAAECAADVDLDAAVAEFIDYWKGIPGQRGRKLDWDATLRNRLRELQERATRNGNNGSRQNYQSASERRNEDLRDNLAIIADLRGEGGGDHREGAGRQSAAARRR